VSALPPRFETVPALAAHYAELLERWADRLVGVRRGTDLDFIAHELRYHAELLQVLARHR